MVNLKWFMATGTAFMAGFCLSVHGGDGNATIEASENLIYGDSSFETGAIFASSDMGHHEFDSSDAWDGRRSLRLIGADATKLKPVDVVPGQDYTFSVYARKEGDAPKTISLEVLNFPFTDKVRKSFPLSNKWERFEVSIIKAKDKIYLPWVLSGGKGVCWIDACQFQKGSRATAYKDKEPVSVSINIDSKFNDIFFNGETVSFDVSMRKAWRDFEANGVQCKLEVKDYYGELVKSDTVNVVFDESGFCKIPYRFEPKKFGAYFLSCVLKKDGVLINEDAATLAVVGKPVAIEEGLKAFCGIDSGIVVPGHERIGVKWIESIVTWGRVESKKGDFKWSGNISPDEIFAYKKAGYKVKATFVPTSPKWASEKPEEGVAFPKDMEDWRNFIREAVSRYKGNVDLWEVGGEVELTFGSSKYYRAMYPDSVVNGFTAGKVAERMGKMIAAASQEIRRLDPGIPIGGIRPGGMGGDYRAGYPFSIAVFKTEPAAFDLFPLDSYCNPRWIGPGRSERGNPEELIKQYKKAFEVSSEYGTGQKVYCSEMAYALDPGTDPAGEFAREHAEKLARAFLVSRMTPNVEMFHYFASIGRECGCEFDLWRYKRPLPAVAAYSNVARVVENVRAAKEVEVMDGVKAVVFRKNGMSVGAVWKYDKSAVLSYAAPRGIDHLEVFDIMGNPLPMAADAKYEIGSSPIFLSSTDEEAFSKLVAYFASAKANAYPARLACRIPRNGHGVVSAIATTPMKLEYELEVKAGDAVCCSRKGVVMSKGREEVEFDFPKDMFKRGGRLSAWIKPKGFDASSIETPLDFGEIKKTDSPFAIDGDLSKWKDRAPLKVFNQKSDIYPPDPWIQWSEKDLSGKSCVGWDDKYFYFALHVNDDIHRNEKSQLYEGDSVQFAFHIPTERNAFGLGYGPDDFEFCMALVKGKPIVSQDVGRTVKAIDCAIKRDDNAMTTDYEVRIPLASLGLQSPVDAIAGFNYVVFDDDTGAGVAKWHMLSPGITEGKNPAAFRKFVLSEGRDTNGGK